MRVIARAPRRDPGFQHPAAHEQRAVRPHRAEFFFIAETARSRSSTSPRLLGRHGGVDVGQLGHAIAPLHSAMRSSTSWRTRSRSVERFTSSLRARRPRSRSAMPFTEGDLDLALADLLDDRVHAAREPGRVRSTGAFPPSGHRDRSVVLRRLGAGAEPPRPRAEGRVGTAEAERRSPKLAPLPGEAFRVPAWTAQSVRVRASSNSACSAWRGLRDRARDETPRPRSAPARAGSDPVMASAKSISRGPSRTACSRRSRPGPPIDFVAERALAARSLLFEPGQLGARPIELEPADAENA